MPERFFFAKGGRPPGVVGGIKTRGPREGKAMTIMVYKETLVLELGPERGEHLSPGLRNLERDFGS